MDSTSLERLSASQWSERTARHLLNRAGFGVPRGRVSELEKIGIERAVAHLVDRERQPEISVEPPELVPPGRYAEVRRSAEKMSPDEQRKLRNEVQKEEREAIQRLKHWWLERMTTTNRPLEEKMTLFWHGHFATSAQKVKSSAANYHINKILREGALGNFKTLTAQVGQSPSMLRYLDNNRNVKGSPNENWARELMELFTLGQGNYSEEDIKESARAFTGWTANDAAFLYREELHDFGQKEFMSRKGDFDGWDILDIIFEQPETSEFICAKLWTYFANEDPEKSIVRGLARTLRDNDYELKPVLAQMFGSKAFYSERAMGTQIKSPTQFAVQLAHDLRLDPPPYGAMAKATAQLGQDLFYPPNVKGWDGGRAWINANTLLGRYNLPKSLISAKADREKMMESGMTNDEDMRENAQERVKALMKDYMQGLPEKERAATRTRIEQAKSPAEKKMIVDEVLDLRPVAASWDPSVVFAGMKAESSKDCVDALVVRFLDVPLEPQRRGVLEAALGVAKGGFTDESMNATLHLLFSAAEYQLC